MVSEVSIVGATAAFERNVRGILASLPVWFVRAARLSRVEVTGDPKVREMIAVYDHEQRRLRVTPSVGAMLKKAVYHELWHGVDDNFGHPHVFSSMDEWIRLHRNQPYFDIPKYREQPLEYLADCGAKLFLMGRERLSVTHPHEVGFIEQVAFPPLMEAFGGQQP